MIRRILPRILITSMTGTNKKVLSIRAGIEKLAMKSADLYIGHG